MLLLPLRSSSSPQKALAEVAKQGFEPPPLPTYCEWGCLVGMYLARRMTPEQVLKFETHMKGCDWCQCQVDICLEVLTINKLAKFSLFYRFKRWLNERYRKTRRSGRGSG